MQNSDEARNLIPSLNPPKQVEIKGFELCDDATHMIAWLGRGNDFRQFVVGDIEEELYRQTPGAQVLAVKCEKPEYKTTGVPKIPDDSMIVVTSFSVTFPVTVRVRATDGVIWNLKVHHNYEMNDMHLSEKRQLRINFNIVGHSQEI